MRIWSLRNHFKKRIENYYMLKTCTCDSYRASGYAQEPCSVTCEVCLIGTVQDHPHQGWIYVFLLSTYNSPVNTTSFYKYSFECIWEHLGQAFFKEAAWNAHWAKIYWSAAYWKKVHSSKGWTNPVVSKMRDSQAWDPELRPQLPCEKPGRLVLACSFGVEGWEGEDRRSLGLASQPAPSNWWAPVPRDPVSKGDGWCSWG